MTFTSTPLNLDTSPQRSVAAGVTIASNGANAVFGSGAGLSFVNQGAVDVQGMYTPPPMPGMGGTFTPNIGRTGAGMGVYLQHGGSVQNGNGALISGEATGITMAGSSGSVANYGSISATGFNGTSQGFGVWFKYGGTIGNNAASAVISGNLVGAYIANGGAITNQGTIRATNNTAGVGIQLSGGGTVTNQAGGLISGAKAGIYVGQAASPTPVTVVNYGTISGTRPGAFAIEFGPGNDLLVAHPGAVFNGLVEGGSNGSTHILELAAGNAPGTLNDLGGQFTNFQRVNVDAGADWILKAATYAFMDTGTTQALTLANSATLEIQSDSALPNGSSGFSRWTATFAGSTGLLELDNPGQFAGTIANFSQNDQIELAGVNATSASISNGQLSVVTSGGNTLNFNVSSAVTGAVTVTPIGGNTIITATAGSPPPPPPQPTTPNGTTADMIMQDFQSGTIELFDIGNNSVLGAYPIGQVGREWQVLGLGDFSGTDTSDFIMREAGSNTLYYFDVADSQVVAANSMGNIGLEWQVLGIGDFSGNPGESDILMRDTGNGQIDYFDIQHNQIVAANLMANIGMEWQVLGIGDFSGNPGESDMLMRDTGNGQIDYFDIQHNQIIAANLMANIGMEWQVLGIGDFSGNPGESDMLMRDTGNGQMNVFDIQHNQIVAAPFMGNIGMEWQVLGFGDFSGNPGESDMLMRDSGNGQIDCFDIQHNQIVAANQMANIGMEWQVFGTAPVVPHG